MQTSQLCDVCGAEVAVEEAINAELAAGELMCPTPMVFHPACYQQATEMWGPPSEDSTCTVDPLFPETMQWPRAGAPET